MPTLAELELTIETTTTDVAKIKALNALAKELQNTDTPRAKTLAESALLRIGENHAYTIEKAAALLVLGRCHYLKSNYDAALVQYRNAHALFEQADNTKGIADALNGIGGVYFSQGDYPNALKTYQASLSIRRGIGDKNGIAGTLGNIGLIYYRLADLPTALKNFQDSLSISRNLDDQRGIATSLLSIGNVYESLANYPEALKHHQESLSIYRDLGMKHAIAASLNNIGIVYNDIAQYPAALKSHKESLSISRDIDNKNGIANSLTNIGKVYESLSDFPNALLHHRDSLHIYHDIHDKKGIALATMNIGSALIKTRQFEQAEAHLQQALSLCDELGLKHQRFETLSRLALLYAETQQFEKAYLTHIEFYKANKAVFSEDNQKKLTTLQVGFETEQAQKEAELYRLKTIDLVEANRFKTELLSIAAHDLKNPLQAIMGFAQLIQEDDRTPQHLVENATVIINASQNMNRLIVDLLDTAAIEQGKLTVTKTPVALAELAKTLIAQYQPQANKKKQTIHVQADDPFVVETDRDKMQRILENLIGNAVKYSPEGKAIWVSLAECNGNVQIAVRDEGQGLTDSDKIKLFQKFQRLSATPTGGENSTGLGLSITKQLVELLGGGIRCESAGKNQGATFVISLPKPPKHLSGQA